MVFAAQKKVGGLNDVEVSTALNLIHSSTPARTHPPFPARTNHGRLQILIMHSVTRLDDVTHAPRPDSCT